jgi:hypothetical protein
VIRGSPIRSAPGEIMADREDEDLVGQFDDWKEHYEAGDVSADELFKQVSNIAVCLSYDLIDKLRFFEKETLKLPEEEIGDRLQHLSAFLEQLKSAYVDFSDVDF